jgi:hypothetical protein
MESNLRKAGSEFCDTVFYGGIYGLVFRQLGSCKDKKYVQAMPLGYMSGY